MLLSKKLVAIDHSNKFPNYFSCSSFVWRFSGVTYSDLKDKLVALVVELESVQDRGELGGVELDCKKY